MQIVVIKKDFGTMTILENPEGIFVDCQWTENGVNTLERLYLQDRKQKFAHIIDRKRWGPSHSPSKNYSRDLHYLINQPVQLC